MYISEIKNIKNYRNLTGLEVLLDPNINFWIGENNLGKTNILELLHCFFSVGKFQEDDFLNKVEAIEISVVVKYNDIKWIPPAEISNYVFCPADEEIFKQISIGFPKN